MSDLEQYDDITIAVILYNSAEVIERSLEPFSQDQKIVVVDNACWDDSVDRVTKSHPNVTIIRNTENRGYGPAANQAVAAADTSYVLLINPDAVMKPGAIGILRERAEENPNCGIVAPFLCSPERGLELLLRGPKGKEYDIPHPTPEGDFCTWFATGAVWLLRKSAWKEIEGFDETIFFYAEDLDFCFRLYDAGKTIVICPDAEGEHLVSKSTPLTNQIQWRKEWNIVWGHLYLLKKHHGESRARAESWRLLRKHFPKMLFYALVFERKRYRRDRAVVSATIASMRGLPPDRS